MFVLNLLQRRSLKQQHEVGKSKCYLGRALEGILCNLTKTLLLVFAATLAAGVFNKQSGSHEN